MSQGLGPLQPGRALVQLGLGDEETEAPSTEAAPAPRDHVTCSLPPVLTRSWADFQAELDGEKRARRGAPSRDGAAGGAQRTGLW